MAYLDRRSGPDDWHNHTGVGKGQRNATLCRLVGVHLARGEGVERSSRWRRRGARSATRPCWSAMRRDGAVAGDQDDRQQQQPHSPLDDESDDVDDGDGVLQADDLIPAVVIIPSLLTHIRPAGCGERLLFARLHAHALHGLRGLHRAGYRAGDSGVLTRAGEDAAAACLALWHCRRTQPECLRWTRPSSRQSLRPARGRHRCSQGMAWGIARAILFLWACRPHLGANAAVSGLASGEGLVEGGATTRRRWHDPRASPSSPPSRLCNRYTAAGAGGRVRQRPEADQAR